MKYLLLFLFALIGATAQCQTWDHIQFDYDLAGNQIKRYVIDIVAGKENPEVVKALDSLVEGDLLTSDIYADVKFYPNPVQEQLYVKWTNVKQVHVENISVFNLGGQKLYNFDIEGDTESTIVNFQPLPEGLFTLVLTYSDGNRKTLKIVKKN
ncbi:MAG TPA: T9SS type A sorting domain-containing protein [Flavobacterium sp.]|jgi:hypothetical protein